MSVAESQFTKFYVELPFFEFPGDEHWNTWYPTAVIEAAEERVDEISKKVFLKVLAPESFRWEEVLKSRYIECPGPARKLDDESYERLIHQLKPGFLLSVGWILA